MRSATAVTETGGRAATTRHIPPRLALSVGMPATPPPDGWRWAALPSIARLESGHTPSRKHPEYWGGSIPWISIQDAKAANGGLIHDTEEKTNQLGIENSSARLLPTGTVCLSRTASVGYVVVTAKPMATSQDFVNWVCSEELEPDFLKYLFIAEGEGLLRFASGAVHPTIYFPEVKAFHICYPARKEQRRIVGILDEALAGIAAAKAHAERNRQNARALFESHLHAVFSHPGLGWTEAVLGNLFEIGSSKRVLKSQWKTEGVPFYRGREITRLSADGFVHNELFISEEHFAALAKQSGVPGAGDIVITAIGTIGNTHIVRSSDRFYFKDASVLWMKRTSDVRSEFIQFWLKSPMFFEQLDRGNGATVDTLTIRKLQNMRLQLPSSALQQRIVRQLDALAAETRRLEGLYERKAAALDELKRSLLHQAFSGQL